MSRSRWICLAAWLLLFLIIFCVWSKLKEVSNAMDGKNTAVAVKEEKAPAAAVEQVKEEEVQAVIENIDSTLQIIKDGDNITLSGLFGNADEVDNTINQFKLFNSNVQKADIEIKEDVNKAKCLDIIQNLAHHFSTNFEKGSIEYKENTLTVKGEVLSDSVKNEVNAIAALYNFDEIKIDNQTTVVEATTDMQKAKKALYELLSLNVVEFETAKGVMTAKGKELIDQVADTLVQYQDLNIVIEGHTDSDGDENANLALSEERANAVKKYLVEKGVEESRMEALGYGESKPVVENTTAENKQENRRVEFKIKGE